jgi:hypothetical protein
MRRIEWSGYVPCQWEIRNEYKIWLKNLKMSSLGDLKHKQDDGNQWIIKKWCEVTAMYSWYRIGLSGGLL